MIQKAKLLVPMFAIVAIIVAQSPVRAVAQAAAPLIQSSDEGLISELSAASRRPAAAPHRAVGGKGIGQAGAGKIHKGGLKGGGKVKLGGAKGKILSRAGGKVNKGGLKPKTLSQVGKPKNIGQPPIKTTKGMVPSKGIQPLAKTTPAKTIPAKMTPAQINAAKTTPAKMTPGQINAGKKTPGKLADGPSKTTPFYNKMGPAKENNKQPEKDNKQAAKDSKKPKDDTTVIVIQGSKPGGLVIPNSDPSGPLGPIVENEGPGLLLHLRAPKQQPASSPDCARIRSEAANWRSLQSEANANLAQVQNDVETYRQTRDARLAAAKTDEERSRILQSWQSDLATFAGQSAGFNSVLRMISAKLTDLAAQQLEACA